MADPPSRAKIAGMFATIAALCVFICVVAYGWVTHGLPDSGNVVLFAVGGMIVAGGFVGFAVSALANIILRLGPPRFRMPLTFTAWLVFCAITYVWLLGLGADPQRLLSLAAIACVFGLLIGPYHAELFVGLWFYNRRLKVIEAEGTARLAEIKRAGALKQEELKRQFQIARDARQNDEERRRAIRNYFRS